MLFLRESGDQNRPAIVFLHGGGLSSRQWQPQLETLSADFYCLAPDLPEQGKSFAVRPFTLQDSARMTAEIIREKVPNKKAHVVGLSLGGAVTLELIRTAPEVVERAMVTGTTAGLGAFLGWITMNSTWIYKLIPENILLDMAVKQFGIPQASRAEFREDLIYGMKEEFTKNFTRALMNVQLPTSANLLVCVGEKETFVAKGAARKLVKGISDAQGVIVPDVGHVWNLEKPDLFSDTVRAWVNNQPLPAALRPISL
jgi:pimeloyl-ACP methyl ester carboxylesterase